MGRSFCLFYVKASEIELKNTQYWITKWFLGGNFRKNSRLKG
jgi:hypothetical protein